MFTITLHAVCRLTWDNTYYVHNHPACCLPSYLRWHPLCSQSPCMLSAVLPETTPTMFTITLHAVCRLTWDNTYYVHNHPACCLPSYLRQHLLCSQSPCMLSAVLPETTPTMSTITLHAFCCLPLKSTIVTWANFRPLLSLNTTCLHVHPFSCIDSQSKVNHTLIIGLLPWFVCINFHYGKQLESGYVQTTISCTDEQHCAVDE